jgi:site-specific DNA-methyltransferase (adenine-specific)
MGGCSTATVAIGMNRRFVGFEASESTFRSRVPKVGAVRPGELLEFIETPEAHVLENRGKSWESDERDRALSRFRALRSSGTSKKDAVAILGDEFQRGPWSILKMLKKYGDRSGSSAQIALLMDID